MKESPQVIIHDALTRRMFLRRSMMMGAGIAGIVTLPTQALAKDPDTTQHESRQEGYRLTKHIAEYYKSAEL